MELTELKEKISALHEIKEILIKGPPIAIGTTLFIAGYRQLEGIADSIDILTTRLISDLDAEIEFLVDELPEEERVNYLKILR